MAQLRSASTSRMKHHSPIFTLFMLFIMTLLLWLSPKPVTRTEKSIGAAEMGLSSESPVIGSSSRLSFLDSIEFQSVIEGESFVRRGKIDDVEFLWQLPPMDSGLRSLKGILFLAHGCGHSMIDWWPRSELCTDCIGLPEELGIVRLALEEFSVVVVAVSSLDRSGSKCWSQKDGPIVSKILLTIKRYFGASLPILAFGASSGGVFCSSTLPKAMEQEGGGVLLDGYISQIAATPQASCIPSVFLTMRRDKRTDNKATELVARFRKDNVPAKHIQLFPVPITSDFFYQRIEQVDRGLSERMAMALGDASMIGEDGELLIDPRHSDWRSVLGSLSTEIGDRMVADESPLAEVMNVAWGMHEMAHDSFKEALEFLLHAID